MSIKSFSDTENTVTDAELREAASKQAFAEVNADTQVRGYSGRPKVGDLKALLNEPAMAEYENAEISIELSMIGGKVFVPAEIITMEIAQHNKTGEIRMVITGELDLGPGH